MLYKVWAACFHIVRLNELRIDGAKDGLVDGDETQQQGHGLERWEKRLRLSRLGKKYVFFVGCFFVGKNAHIFFGFVKRQISSPVSETNSEKKSWIQNAFLAITNWSMKTKKPTVLQETGELRPQDLNPNRSYYMQPERIIDIYIY